MADHRILLLAQKPFGEEAWRRLRARQGDGVHVVAVCTNVSAEAVWWRSNGIADASDGVPIIDNARFADAALEDAIDRFGATMILSVQHPWVVPHAVLRKVDYKALNFHNAKLPTYRGYYAVVHAILAGDPVFTCTAHWMADALDTGAIALEGAFAIEPADTALSLWAKAHHVGLALFDRVVDALVLDQPLARRAQGAGGAFYPRQAIASLREITDVTSDELDRKARAFHFPPFEPAWLRSRGRKYHVVPGGEGTAAFIAATSARAALDRALDAARDAFPYEVR